MKKYRVIDADGEEYNIEEVEEVETEDDEIETTTETVETFTPDEVATLKAILAKADKLLALVEEPVEEPEVTDECDEDVEEQEVEETEEVIDTNCNDSKKSFGAIEKQKTSVDDSLSDDVSDAWIKRFGGR